MLGSGWSLKARNSPLSLTTLESAVRDSRSAADRADSAAKTATQAKGEIDKERDAAVKKIDDTSSEMIAGNVPSDGRHLFCHHHRVAPHVAGIAGAVGLNTSLKIKQGEKAANAAVAEATSKVGEIER